MELSMEDNKRAWMDEWMDGLVDGKPSNNNYNYSYKLTWNTEKPGNRPAKQVYPGVQRLQQQVLTTTTFLLYRNYHKLANNLLAIERGK